MNVRRFFQQNYDLLREYGAFSLAIAAHVVLFLLFCVITFTVAKPDTRGPMIGTIDKTQELPPTKMPDLDLVSPSVAINVPARPAKATPAMKVPERLAVRTTEKTDFIIASPMRDLTPRKTPALTIATGERVQNEFIEDRRQDLGVDSDGSDIRALIQKFVVVQYEGGDWNCEIHGDGTKMHLNVGSIPNLVYEIRQRTRIQVESDTVTVVRADSPEIMKSPFVYFTGHEDFTLTDAEVDNLQTYLRHGYAIVANNALPGRRSRFDVAFRREMKRVIPDHELEPITKDHRLFKAFRTFSQQPPGVNAWREPIEVITLDKGRVVVIYNLNDYGDLMLARLDDTGNAIKYGRRADVPSAWWEGPRAHNPKRYGGCNNPRTVADAFQFNINILAYLLRP